MDRCRDCGSTITLGHGPVDCVRNLKAVLNAANDALYDSIVDDVEHQIECHADTMPAALRLVVTGHAKAMVALQEVIGVWCEPKVRA